MATVLVADDNRFTRVMLGRYVSEVGHEVIYAMDGQDALAQLEDVMPDLMFCDLLMPNTNGVDVLKQLKERSARPRVVICSADIQDSSRDECMELGATDFINKPFTREKIEEVLNKWLGAE